MEIELTLQEKNKATPFAFHYDRMVNAGYVGRNQEEVRRHIDELAKKGIPGPKATPTLYPVISKMLLLDDYIEVYSDQTCGEAEYVLLIENEENIYVGIGSDHTDRHLEETDIARSKQICPNILGSKVWTLDEVSDHWDDLEIESRVVKEGNEVLYQKGRLELILDPRSLLEFVRSKIQGPLENIVVYSGTLGTLTDGFIFGERFSAALIDPKMGRSLKLSYGIAPMQYMVVE